MITCGDTCQIWTRCKGSSGEFSRNNDVNNKENNDNDDDDDDDDDDDQQ